MKVFFLNGWKFLNDNVTIEKNTFAEVVFSWCMANIAAEGKFAFLLACPLWPAPWVQAPPSLLWFRSPPWQRVSAVVAECIQLANSEPYMWIRHGAGLTGKTCVKYQVMSIVGFNKPTLYLSCLIFSIIFPQKVSIVCYLSLTKIYL